MIIAVTEFGKALMFGLVQGITEWLPVSSTGHMLLLQALVHPDVSAAFYELFQVVIQLGSVLAVAVLYFDRLDPFSASKSREEKRRTRQLWGRVAVSVLPLGAVGLLLDDWIEAHFYNAVTVSVTLIVYGVLFLLAERVRRGRTPTVTTPEQMDLRHAIEIGLFQTLAVVPGTSRSGATILGGLLLGLARPLAAEYSFFMAIPVMAGAGGLKAAKYLLRGGPPLTGTETVYLIAGTAAAFLVSMAAVRLLVGYLQKHDFRPFGVYRILLGILTLLFFSAA